jgi:hypothetical protein
MDLCLVERERQQRPHHRPPWLPAHIHRGQVRPQVVIVAVVVLVECAAASDLVVDATPMGHTSCRARQKRQTR